MTPEDQDRWLDDATENVKKQAFYMKRAFDEDNLRAALKCASSLTGELRTGKLSPKNYYELYMHVTDELRELEMHFEDSDQREQKGEKCKSVIELYENVQHAGNIIPRLYLLITVGSVYIKSKRAPAKDILNDMVELCRGVQHPMRGLFLRNYLSQVTKDKLPDLDTEYEGEGGDYHDAIEFILTNFGEMNKLWVRMQHQGALADRSKRETERRNLKQLVGTNLVRLSQLDGVDLSIYGERVLPSILEQIVNCKDIISQEYLMDCIISVFPDDFHLQTLETFLSTCAQLQDGVKVKDIVINMMNRLSTYAQENEIQTQTPSATGEPVEMFALFHTHIATIIQGRDAKSNMKLDDILSLQVALINFASVVYPKNLEYIDMVLEYTYTTLEKAGISRVPVKSIPLITSLLSLPLSSLGLDLFSLEHYVDVLNLLDVLTRKTISVSILTAMSNQQAKLDSPEVISQLFSIVSVLLRDETDEDGGADGGTGGGGGGDDDANVGLAVNQDKFEFDIEQSLVARVFHLIDHEDTDVLYKMYQLVRKHFGQGGTLRIEYTLPPLIFGAINLARRVYEREQAIEAGATDELVIRSKKVFGFIHETIMVLAPHFPEIGFRLFLQAGHMSDLCGYDAISYECLAQAFLVYEEEIADSKAQLVAITLLTVTLQQFRHLDPENYDTLINKATQHSAKLLKKPDQCRAIFTCSHLFWQENGGEGGETRAGGEENESGETSQDGLRDPKRVLACLQRALKVAYGCLGAQVTLFVDILNKYLYFFDRNCPAITVTYLQGLITLINEHIPNLDDSEASKLSKKYYENTLKHIRLKMSAEGAEKYAGLQID